MFKNNQPARLVVKINDNPTPNQCPLCTGKTNPNIGAELFLENTESVVCLDCAMLHSPLLSALVNLSDVARDFVYTEQVAALVTLADAARGFVQYENEFGNEWEAKRKVEARKSSGVLIRFPNQERRSA